MERRLGLAMIVFGIILLLASMLFSTVSFAAPGSFPQYQPLGQQPCPDEPCDDGDPCTYDDMREVYWFQGYCEDSQCTTAWECENICESIWHPGHCEYGECAGIPYSCDDGNVCTEDACDGEGGCHYTPIAGCCITDSECDDGDACTTDSCIDNTCVFTSVAPRPCYTGPEGTEGVGICQGGMQTCSEGSWGDCVGQVLPSTEVCDGLDNDCDGKIDEGGVCAPCANATITVHITQCGAPVAGLSVELHSSGGDRYGPNTTNAAGEATFSVIGGSNRQWYATVGGARTGATIKVTECGGTGAIDLVLPCSETPVPTPTPIVEVLGLERLPITGWGAFDSLLLGVGLAMLTMAARLARSRTS